MSHDMTPDMEAQTVAPSLSPLILVEIDSPVGNAYLWHGLGPLAWNGQTWRGAGKLLSVAAVSETNQTQAVNLSIVLSGLDQATIAYALENARRYYPVKLWIGAMDATGAIVADPFQTHNGLLDTASISADGTAAQITITSEGRLLALMNALERRYSAQDQRIDYPGDAGFDFLARMQDLPIVWG